MNRSVRIKKTRQGKSFLKRIGPVLQYIIPWLLLTRAQNSGRTYAGLLMSYPKKNLKYYFPVVTCFRFQDTKDFNFFCHPAEPSPRDIGLNCDLFNSKFLFFFLNLVPRLDIGSRIHGLVVWVIKLVGYRALLVLFPEVSRISSP